MKYCILALTHRGTALFKVCIMSVLGYRWAPVGRYKPSLTAA